MSEAAERLRWFCHYRYLGLVKPCSACHVCSSARIIIAYFYFIFIIGVVFASGRCNGIYEKISWHFLNLVFSGTAFQFRAKGERVPVLNSRGH